jgi:hypothetical protein
VDCTRQKNIPIVLQMASKMAIEEKLETNFVKFSNISRVTHLPPNLFQ